MRHLTCALALVLFTADAAQAGPFRRVSRTTTCTNPATCGQQVATQPVVYQQPAAQLVTYQQPVYQQPAAPVVYAAGQFSTAQGVAEHMARTGIFGHFGGNAGYEGCGMAATPQAAEMMCCYRNQFQPREVGLAQAANGMWYACCRY